MIARSAIERIEAHAAVAWPAGRSVVVDEWLVRLSDGYTKRANAASAIRSGATLDDVLPAIEAAYASHGGPVQFRLTPLAAAHTDALLAAAGYVACDSSVVMIATTGGAASARVSIAPRADAAWIARSAVLAGCDAAAATAHAALLARIESRTGYAAIVDRGVVIGVGIGVIEDDMVGLFALAVAPGYRGRGHGRAIVDALRHWAGAHGARTAWLQVAQANDRATALYAAAGFATAYRYHYRVAPGAPTAG